MAHTFASGNDSLPKLAEAIGLSGRPILSLNIECPARGPIKIKVEFYAQVQDMDLIAKILQDYKLIPKRESD